MDNRQSDILLFDQIADEIVNTKNYQKLKDYRHHKNISVYDHSIEVAKRCFFIAKKKNLNIKSVVIGALLHDYYLYDWHDKNKGFRWHGFKHAKIALRNANRDFKLDKISQDMIRTHMWPLNLFSIPKYKESWLLVKYDKICSIKDYLEKSDKHVKGRVREL